MFKDNSGLEKDIVHQIQEKWLKCGPKNNLGT